MNDNEIKIEDVLADMRNQIGIQAQEIAILKATIAQYKRSQVGANEEESTKAG
jgi:hypothetical protein